MKNEVPRGALSGGLGLLLVVGLIGAGLWGLVTGGAAQDGGRIALGPVCGVLLLFFVLPGFFIVEPNGSRVMILFGRYIGTVRQNGFFWTVPWVVKRPVSLKARTLNGAQLKVNDAVGNPIEIAAIIIWHVEDTYNALFEVENYEEFVRLQSETAVRHLASAHPYDAEDEHLSLRRNGDQIAVELQRELQERLARAGVSVLEARLSHLAYAPEIANVMLRRQQAAAVIAARQRIVEGAVGMVEMAIQRLDAEGTVALNPAQKAALVANLLVVLCGEQAAQPVVSTGTASA